MGRDDTEPLLAGDRASAERVPAVIEGALVPRGPLWRDVVRGVRGPGRPVDEEGLVGHERLLLADPPDRAIGHVLGEVVALLGRPIGLDRHGVLVDGGRVLVGLAADEAVEVLEPVARRRPPIERAHRARLPDRDLVAFPEMRGGVAVELERLGERRHAAWPERVIARCGRGDLGDAAHADGMVVAPAEQRGAGRRAERRRVEPGVLEPVRRESLERRRVARSAECAGSAETDVVEQDDEDVRCAGRRPDWVDRRK